MSAGWIWSDGCVDGWRKGWREGRGWVDSGLIRDMLMEEVMDRIEG